MICYRDRTYCKPDTCTGKCGRQFTDEDHEAAVKWWGNEDYPLAVSDFCTEHRLYEAQGATDEQDNNQKL